MCCLVFVFVFAQGNFEEVASFLVDNGADPNDIYTDDKGKEHNLLFDSVTLGNEVKKNGCSCFFSAWISISGETMYVYVHTSLSYAPPRNMAHARAMDEGAFAKALRNMSGCFSTVWKHCGSRL